jgi:hypothetical protein
MLCSLFTEHLYLNSIRQFGTGRQDATQKCLLRSLKNSKSYA